MTAGDVHVSHVPGIPVAVIRRHARASELPRVVPEGCGAVWNYLRAHQLKGGRNVAIYWDGSIRLEVGVELDQPLPDGGDIVRSATPAGPVASTTHFGPYHTLGAAHAAIRAGSPAIREVSHPVHLKCRSRWKICVVRIVASHVSAARFDSVAGVGKPLRIVPGLRAVLCNRETRQPLAPGA